jgi:hypothetical protein
VTANPLYGVTFGVVAFAVIQLALTLQAIRRSAARRGPFAERQPGTSTVEELVAERDEARAEVGVLREELEQAQADASGVYAPTFEQEDTRAVNERLRAEIEQLKAQPGDEELKSECFQVSAECYQFVRDHGGSEIGDYLDPQVRRRNDEIMLEYEQSLGGRVNGLLRKLQRRGWWQPETIDPKKRKRFDDPGFLADVQDIAKELNAIGHEH